MFIEQQISIISEGSCDIEDWSNYAENSAFLITGMHLLDKIIHKRCLTWTMKAHLYVFFSVLFEWKCFLYVYYVSLKCFSQWGGGFNYFANFDEFMF